MMWRLSREEEPGAGSELRACRWETARLGGGWRQWRLKGDLTALRTEGLFQRWNRASGHIWMWALDYKESWAPRNWCFWTVVLKILESPLDCKEIQPVNPKGNQSWIFIGRTDVEAETPILWPPDAELTLKRPWCWERLKVGGEGDDRGWDGWMASMTQWTWVWGSSGSWWWTGRPGVLQAAKSRTRLSDWTELNWYRSWGRGRRPGGSRSIHRLSLLRSLPETPPGV